MRTIAARALEAVVVLLAVYAFVAVPVGKKTLWGHVVAIASTSAAKAARDDVASTFRRLWTRRSLETGRGASSANSK